MHPDEFNHAKQNSVEPFALSLYKPNTSRLASVKHSSPTVSAVSAADREY